MSKGQKFDDALAEARCLLNDRASRLSPNNNMIKHFTDQFDLSERLADNSTSQSESIRDVDMSYIADREIADMDPEFAQKSRIFVGVYSS